MKHIKGDLQSEIKKLANQITISYNSYLILKQITTWYNEDEDYTSVISQSSTFWSITKYSIMTQLILELTHIYDEHRGTISLTHLINKFKNNLAILNLEEDPVSTTADTTQQPNILFDIQLAIQKSEKLLANISPTKEKLHKYRNKQIAHTDLDVLLKQKALPNLTWEEIQHLMETAMEIINSFSVPLMNHSYVFKLLYIDDIEYMFQDAVRGKKSRLK